ITTTTAPASQTGAFDGAPSGSGPRFGRGGTSLAGVAAPRVWQKILAAVSPWFFPCPPPNPPPQGGRAFLAPSPLVGEGCGGGSGDGQRRARNNCHTLAKSVTGHRPSVIGPRSSSGATQNAGRAIGLRKPGPTRRAGF